MHPFDELINDLREAAERSSRNNKRDNEDRFETTAISIHFNSGAIRDFKVGEEGVEEITVCQCEDLTKVMVDLGDTRKVFEGTFDVELTGTKVASSINARKQRQANGTEKVSSSN